MADAGEYVDALVVGSGFGGSVAALRLAAGGRSVVVMERGKAYRPGDFPRTPAQMGRNFWDPSEHLYGLFDAWTFRGLEGLVASGVGGGSLIYANVLLRKDEKWFVNESPLPGGGYEHWPVTRDDLDPHYAEVESMLGATPYPYDDTPKTLALERAARALGLEVERPKLGITFGPRPGEAASANVDIPDPGYRNLHGLRRVTCTLCGECDVGCNSGAKNTLDHTYLSAAVHRGAQVRELHEVRGIRPRPEGGYDVRYVVHDPGDRGATATRQLSERSIRCRRLVLAAGTFGTTFLLLRNRASLPALSSALGTRFCGNGDLLTLLTNCRLDGEPLAVDAGHGPVITTAVKVGDAHDGGDARGRGFYIEDAGFPGFVNWLVELSQVTSVARRAGGIAQQVMLNRLFTGGRSNISKDLAAAFGDGRTSVGTLPLLGMGRDVPDGIMTLHQGHLAIDWTMATSDEYFARMRRTMEQIAGELGADFRDNPLWWAKRVITVHPLGGAPLGRSPADGLCDSYGEVFGHPGLHVLDGAAMPGPVGANPALTIAALADRAAQRMVEQDWGTQPSAARRAQPSAATAPHVPDGPDAPDVPVGATSIRFTEQMRGSFTLGITEPRVAAQAARMRRHSLMFEVTIHIDDVTAFVADPQHAAAATGYVRSDVLGGRLPVERGWFHLFVRSSAASRRMRYRLWFTDAGGTPFTLVGSKDLADDAGPDTWADSTTLFIRLLEGHVPPPPVDERDGIPGQDEVTEAPDPAGAVRGAGVLVIRPLDFARQLTTFRTRGPDGAAALAAFGRLFLGELWDVYVARHAARPRHDAPVRPPAPIGRIRR